jgi:hypothetical protein
METFQDLFQLKFLLTVYINITIVVPFCFLCQTVVTITFQQGTWLNSLLPLPCSQDLFLAMNLNLKTVPKTQNCGNSGFQIGRSWIRHYATSRKVTGSIPDEVIGFFNWPNPSSRTTALGSTQPLTEMSTRSLSRGKMRQACKASTSHNPMGLHGLSQG